MITTTAFHPKLRHVVRVEAVPRRRLGRSDVFVSRLSLGTMLFGERTSRKEAEVFMDYSFDHGINFFDTAEMYPVPQSHSTAGLSETFLGEWMKHKPREEIIISCKVCGPSGQMMWIRNGPASLDKRNIKESVEGSLLRLQTDYIDLLHLHWPDRYVPMFGEVDYDPTLAIKCVGFDEQFEALEECVEEGKVRCIGLSNETPYGVMKFCQLANQHSHIKIASLQNAYNLLCRNFDSGLAECCFLEKISLLAYSPLAMGLLTGKYLDPGGGPPGARLNLYKERYAEAESRYGPRPNAKEAVRKYLSLAEESGMNLSEMAIRFVLHHPLVTSGIIGVTDIHQLTENIKYSIKGPLDHSLITRINTIHHAYPNPTP